MIPTRSQHLPGAMSFNQGLGHVSQEARMDPAASPHQRHPSVFVQCIQLRFSSAYEQRWASRDDAYVCAQSDRASIAAAARSGPEHAHGPVAPIRIATLAAYRQQV